LWADDEFTGWRERDDEKDELLEELVEDDESKLENSSTIDDIESESDEDGAG
jgi:hypothetical protein